MDAAQNYLVIATAGRLINIFDVRNLSTPVQCKESVLKSQTRSVSCFPDGKGYAITSVEGRIGIEYFETSDEVQALKYAFKCHRSKVNDVDVLNAINTVEFHPTYV